MAGDFFEGADARGEGLSCAINGGGRRIVRGGFFDFGDEGGADDGSVGEAAKNGDVPRQRDAEAYSDGKLRDVTRAAQKCGEIIGKRIFGASHSGAGDKIEKTRGYRSDFREAVIRGSRRAEKNRVEMMGGEDATVVVGFFWSEVRDEDAVGSGRGGGARKFFEAHLENGIVVTEENERDLARFSNFSDKFDDSCERGV